MNKKILVINFGVLIFYLLDRFFKSLFSQNPKFNWDFVFGWRLSKNYGIAFSLPFYSSAVIIIILAVIFVLVSFLVLAYRKNNFFEITFLTLIIFGAFSNLLDRLRFGFVIDYIDVPYFTVLNLADVMIAVGVGMILLKEIFFKSKSENKG